MKHIYLDRPYLLVYAPPQYHNQVFIRTRNNDRDLTSIVLLSFQVSQPVVVSIALDVRISPAPDWLGGGATPDDRLDWVKTDDRFLTTDGQPYRVVYRRKFEAGTISLGPNRDPDMPAGRSMYAVLLEPIPEARASGWAEYQ